MTDTPNTLNGGGLGARQKRIMPSRSRRGGPGIGSTEVDLMILDTQKRKLENEPLIPADTKFLLTTNSSRMPSSSSSTSTPFELELNSHAYERYFDRPEVLESYKAQLIIQTPEFSNLTEDASVGGRFRPRIHEDDIADTSDAAYEKRHRKYETFEKRQRLREKEKLKHEQYKLKERMEQLRAMDGSAFLALPSSSFSPIPSVVPDNINGELNNVDIDELPGAHANGTAAYHEGERRRKEMLDVAMGLEERYRILLPPPRKHLERSEQLKQNAASQASGSAEPDVELEDEKDEGEEELDTEQLVAIAVSNKQGEKLKLKIKITPSREESTAPAKSASTSASATAPAQPKRKRPTTSPIVTKNSVVHRSQSRALVHSPSTMSSLNILPAETVVAAPSPLQPMHPEIDTLDAATVPEPTKAQRKSSKQVAEPVSRPRPYKRLRETTQPLIDDNGDVEMTTLPHIQVESLPPTIIPQPSPPPVLTPTSMSAPPTRAKSSHPRAHSHTSPKPGHTSHSGSGTATNMERTSCFLMVSAMRAANAPLARKTQRHVTAFGVKVPDSLDDIREFELPWWILSDDEEEHEPPEPVYVQTRAGSRALIASGFAVGGGPERHVKGHSRADGGDVEFRRFLDDVPSHIQQNSEKAAVSALLQL